MLDELRERLSGIPDVEIPAAPDGVEETIAYLDSDAAEASLAADAYWPKWDSPWWRMVLLYELGEARRIPARAVRAMVAALDALPMHTFPLRPEDWPPGLHPARHASCHCALGSIDQVLHACGVDVDAELPWIRPWYARYQMRDGGLNCDETAYLVADECPSSMVGTVPVLEALLRRGPGETADRAAGFLIGRRLVRGSDTRHNAEEREAAKRWVAPTFPRFYFYDVLRGVTALARWATALQRAIPARAIAPAVDELVAITGDGIVRIGRRTFPSHGTWIQQDGAWNRVEDGATFPLLEAVSQVGAPSAALTVEWRATRRALVALIDAGLVTALVLLAACGGRTSAPEVGHAEPAAETSVVRDCWLGEASCDLELDLDGDGRVDRVALVREATCDGACARGVEVRLATGATLLVGAGRAIDARAHDDPELEPLSLEEDLGFVVSIRVGRGDPPCAAEALVVSGGDAAAQICVLDGEARAYHLGF